MIKALWKEICRLDLGIDVEGIRKTVFPHPTLSEAFFEAALAVSGDAIHMAVEPKELTPEDFT